MVRQFLEGQSRNVGIGIGVVGDEVAAANLDRVHVQGAGSRVDKTFADGASDGMADRAVLAHGVLVGENDPGVGPVVLDRVGGAGQVDDLVGLDPAGARIDRIGADPGQIVDVDGGELALFGHRHARLDPMVAGMDVGHERFHAVGNELDRTLQHDAERRRSHFVGVGVNLDAVGAADILADHPDPIFVQAEMLGVQVLHHVRRLRRQVYGQMFFGRVVVGDDGARLQADAGMAAEMEGFLDDAMGIGEGLVDFPDVDLALKTKIVAEIRVDDRRRIIERGFHVGDDGAFLVVDFDQSDGVLGLGSGLRDDGGDGFALPAGPVHGDGVLRRRFEALQMGEYADPGGAVLGQLAARDDANNAWRILRCLGVRDFNFCVREGTAAKGDVHHARQRQVVGVGAAAFQQPFGARARDALADEGVRPVEDREGRFLAHDDPSPRCRPTVSMASTIAWYPVHRQ